MGLAQNVLVVDLNKGVPVAAASVHCWKMLARPADGSTDVMVSGGWIPVEQALHSDLHPLLPE